MTVRSLWIESVWQDVRLALRGLRRNPSFLIVSMISLALGIGVNVSVFSFVDALFLRPPPGVSNPSELVTIQLRSRTTGGSTGASYQDFEYLQQRAASFSGIVAFTSFSMTIRAGDLADSVRGELVSDTYFRLGVHLRWDMLERETAAFKPSLLLAMTWNSVLAATGVIGRTIGWVRGRLLWASRRKDSKGSAGPNHHVVQRLCAGGAILADNSLSCPGAQFDPQRAEAGSAPSSGAEAALESSLDRQGRQVGLQLSVTPASTIASCLDARAHRTENRATVSE
jgi:hypothetical protein